MRIDLDLQAFRLRRPVFAPDLRISDEEALLGRETFHGLIIASIGFPFRPLGIQGHHGNANTAVVGGVLAQGKAAIKVYVVDGYERTVLVGDATGALVKLLAVCGRPPVSEVSYSVELTALVIEAVREFVSDDDADAAIIYGFILGIVEKWRLQNS